MVASIDDLPNEILEFVFNLLPPYEPLEHCAEVCKRWNLLATNVRARKNANLQKGLIDFNLCWKEILHESNPRIAARFAHASTLHRNAMYVFGGASSYDTTFNDLWKFDLSRREWVRPISMGTYPSPKAGASLVCHNDTLILYGGWRHAYTPFHMCTLIDELHVYNITENRWTIQNQVFGPPRMTGHSATVHNNQMVIFGGYQMDMETIGRSNDIWVLDLKRLVWKKPAVSEVKPAPRYGQFQMAIGDSQLLVLGGTGGFNHVFNDAWLLDMQRETWVWKRVQIKNKTVTHNWVYPACNVGTKVVVLGPTSPNDFQIIRPNRPAGPQLPGTRLRLLGEQRRHMLGMPQGAGVEPNIPRNSFPQRPNLPPPPAPAPVQPPASASALSGPTVSRKEPSNPTASVPSKSSTANNVPAEPKPGPSGLRSLNSPSVGPPSRPIPMIRGAFGRHSSEDNHLPRRFNQQHLEQNHMALAAFSVDSSNQTPTTSPRERQLEQLRKMEEKISAMRRAREAEQQQLQNPENRPVQQDDRARDDHNASAQRNRDPTSNDSNNVRGSDPITPKRVKRNGLAIYVCDVSNLLLGNGAEPSIEWQESKNSGLVVGAPDHYTFSTMVNGNGELIVFGGLNKNHKSEDLCVTNSVHFLTVPTTVV